MKRFLVYTFVGAYTFTTFAVSAVAQTSVPPQGVSTAPSTQTLPTNRITDLKNRADIEITRRLTSLTNLTNRINAMKKLSTSQKTTLTTQIQTEITNLTNLKTKIDADTDFPTLRADVKSIVDSYRVYALFIPQLSIIAASDRMGNVIDTLQALVTKLQTRVQNAKNNPNSTTMQSALADMQAKLSDATTQYQNATNAVIGLTPDGYPGNRATLLSARTMLQTGRTDLKIVVSDAKSIIQLLKNPNAPIQTSTTASPTLTPTVTPT